MSDEEHYQYIPSSFSRQAVFSAGLPVRAMTRNLTLDEQLEQHLENRAIFKEMAAAATEGYAAGYAAGKAETQWFRIDDLDHPAPRDGTEILLCVDGNLSPPQPILVAARWGQDRWLSVWSEAEIGYGLTHWMPLPPPPAGEE